MNKLLNFQSILNLLLSNLHVIFNPINNNGEMYYIIYNLFLKIYNSK